MKHFRSIKKKDFYSIYDSLKNSKVSNLRNTLKKRHPADIADIYEDIRIPYRTKLLDLFPEIIDAQVLKFLEKTYKNEVIKYLGATHFQKSLKKLQNDEIVELLDSLDPKEQKQLIEIIDISHKTAIDIFNKYKEHSIGRCMSLDFILLHDFWTAEKALTFIKDQEYLSKDCSEIFISNGLLHPIGVISITSLLNANKNQLLSEIADYEIMPLNANLDQEKAYDLSTKYHLTTIPVVEKTGRMIGILRPEDLLKIFEKESAEDYLRFTGAEIEHKDTFLSICFERLRWLFVPLINTLFSPMVIDLFQDTIQHVISLAILMPIVGSIGGNIGMQAVSVTIQGFSSKQLREYKFTNFVFKEASIGALNGLIIGGILGIIAGIYFGNLLLGSILASSMLFVSIWAAAMGSFMPIIFNKLGYDSSLSSGPLVISLSDISGYATFLGLAHIMMR